MGKRSTTSRHPHRSANWLDHPTIAAALTLARYWCPADRLAEHDALAHGLEVVDVLCGHLPAVAPEVVAAVLLQDSHEFAPPGVDLDATLATLISWEVARIVRALRHEHDAVGRGDTVPAPATNDLAVVQASAADKIVRLRAVLDRSERSHDTGYLPHHQGVASALPYLRALHRSARRLLPPPMAAELGGLVTRVELRLARIRWPGTTGFNAASP